MSTVVLATIIQATCSGITLRNKSYTESSFNKQKTPVFSPDFLLGEALKTYDYKSVEIRIIFANTIEKAEEYSKSETKGHIYKGTLRSEHCKRSTDWDDWFESSASIDIKVKVEGKKNKTITETIDINELFEGKKGKGVFLEIK